MTGDQSTNQGTAAKPFRHPCRAVLVSARGHYRFLPGCHYQQESRRPSSPVGILPQLESRLSSRRDDEVNPSRGLFPKSLWIEEPEILAKMRAGERIEQYETVRVTKAGERIDLSLTISPIRDDTGKIIGASKIAHDISERKTQRREVRLRLAAIVESSDDAIIGMDLNGIITDGTKPRIACSATSPKRFSAGPFCASFRKSCIPKKPRSCAS